MNPTIVSTKAELKVAQERGAALITVTGSLADNMKKSKKVALAGAATIAVLTAAIAAIPFTGGLSVGAAVPVAALTGLEIAAIIATASVGVTLIVAVFNDYEEVSYEEGKLTLRKKSK